MPCSTRPPTRTEWFEQIDKRFEQIDRRFEKLESRFDQLQLRVMGGLFAIVAALIAAPHL
ncbi:MAG TPA: hypothetical protein VFT19_11230 [Solirubrobacterales bacterium]|nr:hypothetical protein [Solirubrobacterales bacterium]